MHAHPRASTYPQSGGRDGETPVILPCGVPSLSAVQACLQAGRLRSGTWGPGGAPAGDRGPLGGGTDSLPLSLPPTDRQLWAHEGKAPRLFSSFAKGRADRGTRRILFCACVSSSFWDPDHLLLPSHPQALCLYLIKALFSFPPHPSPYQQQDQKAGGASGFRSETRRPTLGQQV